MVFYPTVGRVHGLRSHCMTSYIFSRIIEHVLCGISNDSLLTIMKSTFLDLLYFIPVTVDQIEESDCHGRPLFLLHLRL